MLKIKQKNKVMRRGTILGRVAREGRYKDTYAEAPRNRARSGS